MKELYQNNKKIIKYIIIGIIFIIILAVGILYEKNSNFRNVLDKYVFLKEKHENNLPTISISSEKGLNIFAHKSSIFILKDNILTIYNKYGNVDNTLDIEVSNPIFKANGDYICIAEKDGKRLYMLYNQNILWQKDLENDISDVTINSNGYLAASLSGTIYKTIIQMFDNKGNYLFKTFLSTTYIVDMDISPDNKHIAIAEVNYSGILIQSNVKIISVEKAQNGSTDYIEYTHAGESGDLIISIKYENANELACIYDSHIETIKNDTNNSISDFKNEDVLFVDINNRIIKIIKEDSKIFLQIMNASGDFKKIEIDEPKEMYVSDNINAINLGSRIFFYNNSGWLVKKYYATQEINKVVLSSDIAGIVYNDKIELISF